MGFPTARLRRLRQGGEGIRRLVRETRISVEELVAPLFVLPGHDRREPLESLAGVARCSADLIPEAIAQLRALGLGAVILFGIPESKDGRGSGAYAPDGVIQQAVARIKDRFPDVVVVTDVCLCEYTDHGHCGILRDGRVDNDATIELLARTAVSHARAGADVVAPSDMMDGRVRAIRQALDTEGLVELPILSYAAKYASAFYGPFREAAGSAPSFGDRSGYQMDPANAREAMREVALDVEEGADMVLVKPALAYLDVVHRVRDRFDVPVGAYNVSGEYAMVKAAAARGWIDERRVVLEMLTGIRRAGADFIVTYHARDAARWIAEGEERPRPQEA